MQEEIFKPTYITDASMKDESFFSALAKSGTRKKSLAFIGNVVSKLTGKQSMYNQDDSTDIDEGIFSLLHLKFKLLSVGNDILVNSIFLLFS